MRRLRFLAAALALAACAPAAADGPRVVSEIAADAMFGETLFVRFEPGATEPIEIVAGGVRACGGASDCAPATFRWSPELPGVLADAGEAVWFHGVLENEAGTRCWIQFYGFMEVVDSTAIGAGAGPDGSPSAAVQRRAQGYVSGSGDSAVAFYLGFAGQETYPVCYWSMYSGTERYNATFTTGVALSPGT